MDTSIEMLLNAKIIDDPMSSRIRCMIYHPVVAFSFATTGCSVSSAGLSLAGSVAENSRYIAFFWKYIAFFWKYIASAEGSLVLILTLLLHHMFSSL